MKWIPLADFQFLTEMSDKIRIRNRSKIQSNEIPHFSVRSANARKRQKYCSDQLFLKSSPGSPWPDPTQTN